MLLCIVGLYIRYQKFMDNKVYIIIFLVTAASAALTITNGPQDTTVCINQVVNCTCGFTGADPNIVVPNWRIIKRKNGVVVSDEDISGNEILRDTSVGLEWIADPLNGNSSVLRVGPVDRTDDQSSYQCSFALLNRVIESSIGTLTVLDPPSLINITVEDTGTTFITISWISTSVGSVIYTITGDVMVSFTTIDTQYTINGLTSGTSYRISVVPSVGMCQGEGKEVIVNTRVSPSIPIEVKTPVNQQQLNTDTIKMQSSPAYVPVGQDNDPNSSIVPQYDTVQVPSDHQDVPMMANPAYLTHKNI
ncbi:uncharacterized protein [Dysidea avara]|uniref:uncharacterized protein isoform X2 n=1 Tax=Dysidea avara TaxID=196820 RepID=UPI00332199E3